MITLENISIITQIATLVGIVFVIYKTFREPDIKAAQQIAIINERCKLKHDTLDENIILIKDNHLKHLEENVSQMKIDITRIYTILEERLPKK